MLRARCAPTPAVARLSALTAVRRPAVAPRAAPRPSLSSVDRLASSFTGLTLAPARRPGTATSAPSRAPLTVVANSRTSMGCTKRGTRRRATRTSGFRARMATPSGRAIIRARRKKGRKVLCTKSLYRKP